MLLFSLPALPRSRARQSHSWPGRRGSSQFLLFTPAPPAALPAFIHARRWHPPRTFTCPRKCAVPEVLHPSDKCAHRLVYVACHRPLPVFRVVLHPPRPRFSRLPPPEPSCLRTFFFMSASPVCQGVVLVLLVLALRRQPAVLLSLP